MLSADLSTQSTASRTTSEPPLKNLLPEATDRALFVGQTGSGKTTLAKALLQSREYVVVHDGKGTLDWRGYHRVEKLRDLMRLDAKKYPRIIYRPEAAELRDFEATDHFFRWVYLRRNTLLYVDEAYAVSAYFWGRVPPHYHACITRGRERGVPVWSATQRPSGVPLVILSESESAYIFRLQVRDDRARIESLYGIAEEQIARLTKWRFYHARAGEETKGPLILKLRGG